MKVLIACEFSGIVRDAFIKRGHDAMSADLLPSERPGPHYQGDVKDILADGWDLMIAHPPCQYLSRAGARWWNDKNWGQHTIDAANFVFALRDAPIKKIAIENPIGRLNKLWRYPDQTIQPWQFGHGETKATCLWLKNLPLLKPSKIVTGRQQRIIMLPDTKNRRRERSRTYPGIAEAMAETWGAL